MRGEPAVILIDTHAHLDQSDFDADRTEVIARARQSGLAAVIAIGTTAPTSQTCVELASQFDLLYAAVGIQPNYAGQAQPGDWGLIEKLCSAPRVVALGETGLDRHWDYTPFPVQQDYFDRHLRLAQTTGLPLVIHTRDCDADILPMLREARTRGPIAGVMHSFTGAAETAAQCVELGLYISFAGMVTFKKSHTLRQIAAGIPADRILIETDSPYLAPEPLRGTRNEPQNLVYTAACLAAERGLTEQDFAELTTANARQLFRLPA
jgi:TatD DNase family protein